MFNNFIWGGYLLHEWPEQRVFIDGGTDHYGEKLFNEYIQVWNLEPGWRDVLKRWDIDSGAAAARAAGWPTSWCGTRDGDLALRFDRRDPAAGARPRLRICRAARRRPLSRPRAARSAARRPEPGGAPAP